MKARDGLVVAVVLVMMALALIVGTSTSRTLTTTIAGNNPGVAIEEVIIQHESVNGICFVYTTNSTTTLLLRASNESVSATTTETETFVGATTVTVYRNVTLVSGTLTCTEINPHYGVTTSTCPPCA